MTLIGTKAPATTTTTRVNFEILQKKKNIYQGFLSRTLDTFLSQGSMAREGRYFILLFHFQTLTNIQTII